MIHFAHAGHVHEEVIPVAAHPNTWQLIGLNLLPFVGLAVLLLGMRYVLKLKLKYQLIVSLVFLLICGLTSFQWAPVASIISLVAGFGLSLALILLPAQTSKPTKKS